MIFIYSPLQQFDILPLLNFYFLGVDFSFTNETIMLLCIFGTFFILINSFFNLKDATLFLIPHRWQIIIETIYKVILSLINDNIGLQKGQFFFPLLFCTFLFIISLNAFGLIPYTFTLTSHLIVTLTFSLFLFIGINIICISIHGLKFFSLFLPSGASVVLSLLLVPIELLSYIFKPVSLSIRLFANMMAGHTLLKVIVGFAWNLLACTGILFLISLVPLLILLPLFALEFGVAIIQGFVFTILIAIYINDALNLH